MTSTATHGAAAARGGAAPSGQTAFERTLLPDFTAWLVERVRALSPDAFVPVETKGAHLLDAVLACARQVGTPLSVPVLYAPALAYVDRAQLAGWKLALLDDATRTGRALERHRVRIERYGASAFSMLACVGLDDRPDDRLPGTGLDEIECFRHVGPDVYRELVWQLAELVVARGLPPEVDHHVFRLTMRSSLADDWATLTECLRHFGNLSVDGPVATSADVVSMTLHYPAFTDSPRYPLSGAVRDEGVKKLRLFADLRRGSVFVVPMAFPALTLPAGADHRDVPEELCRSILREWTSDRPTVADTMIAHACTRDADMLFRAVSTATEVDLVRGFARALARELPGAPLKLSGERNLFARLHGPVVGELVADRIDAELATAVAEGREAGPTGVAFAASSGEGPPVQRLDATVVSTTIEIAKYLKRLSDRAAGRPGGDPLKRVGLSLSELARRIRPDGIDPYLLSRCIDYGLATTTLVPFTDVTPLDDGSVEGRRTYGVSEIDPFDDRRMHRQCLEEETIALLARTLARSTQQWRERVPLDVVARAAAILNPLLADYQLSLTIAHGEPGPQLMLGDDVQPVSIYAVASEHFMLEDDAIVPTEWFEQRYDAGDLLLDACGEGAALVEALVRALAPLLDGAEDPEGLLLAWATSTGNRMGLEVVERHLRTATEQLRSPLAKLIRRDRPDPSELLAAARRARELIAAAQDAVELLNDDSALDPAACKDPDRAQRRMLASLRSPSQPDALLRLARQTCAMAAQLARQVELLAEWPAGEDAPENDARERAAAVADAMAQLEREATTLAADGASDGPPSDPADLAAFAAECVKRGVKLVRARAAALAWTNRGVARGARAVGAAPHRLATVLAADLMGSTPRSRRDRHVDNVEWVRRGLDLVAQWARAFGGTEVARNGDEVLLEFASADAALLCGAVVQRHTAALRATGRSPADWELRIAADSGEITDERDNDVGAPLNVASKLAKFHKDAPAAFERVLVSPATAELCSTALRDALTSADETFDLDPHRTMGPDASGMRFIPQQLDAAAAVDAVLRQGVPAAGADVAA